MPFVILDEATKHNSFTNENVFTAVWEKSAKFMVTGDPGQVDLPRPDDFRFRKKRYWY
jgi:phosphate starvation-inducible protein PhoH